MTDQDGSKDKTAQSLRRIDDIEKYKEVCVSHRAITEFRGKLLTLLPIASGMGVYLLIPKDDLSSSLGSPHLFAIGIFGFLVTLGLFLHELRGIQHCGELINLGSDLERKFGESYGHFCGERAYYHESKGWKKFYNNVKGPVGAAAIIYPSVGLAWLYVAVLGYCIPKNVMAWVGLFILVLFFVSFVHFVPPCSEPKRKYDRMY